MTGPWGDLLGEGMEGTVYAIDETRVAKVWHHGSVPALTRLARFYAGLDAKPFSFAVPRILRVTEVDGAVVTIERRLAGTPGRATADAVVDLVAELAASGPLPAARDLTVLGGDLPLTGDFPDALARLTAQRSSPALRRAVDHHDAKAAALAGRLRDVDTGRRSVIHGDLVPANILVDDEGRPSAVLDWGFLTTEGDPAFEAAVAAAIFDMYGPSALETERRLLGRMGYDVTTLLVYRAAYSLITATAYDPDGNDGHFAWCVAALNRSDVTWALLG